MLLVHDLEQIYSGQDCLEVNGKNEQDELNQEAIEAQFLVGCERAGVCVVVAGGVDDGVDDEVHYGEDDGGQLESVQWVAESETFFVFKE